MKIKSTLLAFGLAIGSACNSAAPQPIPKEILFGNPEKVSPALSPDGTKLALLAPDENNVLNVWVDGEKVTSDAKRGIRSFLWQYDNRHILYSQDKDGDEIVHLYQTDLESKETRCLTPAPGVCAFLLSYEPKHPDQALVLMNLRNPVFFDGYKIDLNSGEAELVCENTDGSIQFVADENLEIRAAVRYGEGGETIVSAKESFDSPWKEVMRWSAGEQGHILSFTPDGASLYIVTDSGTDTACLIKLNVADGSREIVAQDPNYDLMGFLALHEPEAIFNPISREIEAVRVNREKPEWIVLDPKIERDFSLLQQEGVTLNLLSRDLSDRRWIVSYSADLFVTRYFLYDRETEEKEFLFSAKPKLDQYALSPIQPVSFRARDNMLLHGYLTLPLGKKAQDLPAVLFVHGGPWARDSWGFSPLVQWLANRGYAILQVNFRGSVGYGKEYLNAGNREWAGKMHTDILDGKQWLIDQKIADPEKIAIMGGSYGGYETLVSLTFSPTEFCCGIDLVGPSNLVSFLETVPPYWGPFKPIFDMRVGKLETERSFLESRSPLFKVDQICRPLFIVQGANDPRIKQAESDQIVDAMRKSGKEVEYLLIEDEGHGFARPENMLHVIERSEEFLQRHLGQ